MSTIDRKKEFNGKLSVEDTQIPFDDTFYFNIPKAEKIAVLAINENSNSTFLKKLYAKDEFLFQLKKDETSNFIYEKIQYSKITFYCSNY